MILINRMKPVDVNFIPLDAFPIVFVTQPSVNNLLQRLL